MTEPIISVSGLRGIIATNLNPLIVMRYASAFAAGLPTKGAIVVSRDGRGSGTMLASAIESTLIGHGFDVLNAGVAATPTTGVLVREHSAVGGIQISASHNPAPYNGMKLFGADGRVVSADIGDSIKQKYQLDQFDWQPHDQLGNAADLDDTTSEHLRLVLGTVDIERIRQQRYKVVLDSNHGAGAKLGSLLLKELNCQFDVLGKSADGKFEHLPEPTEKNLRPVADYATGTGADVVFCQDPDADRLAVIDENGVYIGEEYTLAITMNRRLSQQQGTIVFNCATSRMSADIAQMHGSDYVISAVGEANVSDQMIAVDAVYGGEGNGGPIDPKVGYVRDSFVAMAQILDAMAAEKKSISQIVSGLPRYEIEKTTVDIDRDRIPELFDQLRCLFPDAQRNEMDGLRLDWPDSWLLVRPSNTEPIVRAIAESKTASESQKLCDQVEKICQRI